MRNDRTISRKKMQDIHNKPISRGTLWSRLRSTYEGAIASGALLRFATDSIEVVEGGIPFIVRVAVNLQRKAKERKKHTDKDADINPFLPPETALTVGAIGGQHLAVLNKYNVVDYHLLIVTRQFEEQENLLTACDLQALCFALAEIDGLGFYNGGTVAGASQRHKHLQLIPVAGINNSAQLPIETAMSAGEVDTITRMESLPFPHLIAHLDETLFDNPQQAASHCHALYLAMLQQLGCVTGASATTQHATYNLLLTRRWLMVVPRYREKSHDISINAMGFAGSLFVMDVAGLEKIRLLGPCRLLVDVTTR